MSTVDRCQLKHLPRMHSLESRRVVAEINRRSTPAKRARRTAAAQRDATMH